MTSTIVEILVADLNMFPSTGQCVTNRFLARDTMTATTINMEEALGLVLGE